MLSDFIISSGAEEYLDTHIVNGKANTHVKSFLLPAIASCRSTSSDMKILETGEMHLLSREQQMRVKRGVLGVVLWSFCRVQRMGSPLLQRAARLREIATIRSEERPLCKAEASKVLAAIKTKPRSSQTSIL